MIERRKAERLRSYLGARIAFNQRYCTVDCLVRNLSQNGARIAIPSTVGIPSTFDLSFKDSGETRRARIVWAQEDAVGVVYDSVRATNVVPFELPRQGAADNQRLMQRIAQVVDRGEPC